jgi:hypothetical protein
VNLLEQYLYGEKIRGNVFNPYGSSSRWNEKVVQGVSEGT